MIPSLTPEISDAIRQVVDFNGGFHLEVEDIEDSWEMLGPVAWEAFKQSLPLRIRDQISDEEIGVTKPAVE